ncbi:hypothetical protein GCM10019016_103070 [Streptomyces prasinosporus]|uniref:EF-hand domain-containing protein n=1 Tax=Streptomyces prasinosporus TaxID=68256 RepID=A0ABP6U666_9ACTN
MAEGGRQAVFDVVDGDGANEITKDEFARFPRDVRKSDAPDAMDVFTGLDTDGDGAISRHEFPRAIRECWLSDDPDAPGSPFFGHVRPPPRRERRSGGVPPGPVR